MSDTARIIIITASVTTISICFLILVLLMFVFPAVNKKTGSDLPCIRFGSDSENEPENQDMQKSSKDTASQGKPMGKVKEPVGKEVSKEKELKRKKKPKAEKALPAVGPTARPTVRSAGKRPAAPPASAVPSKPAVISALIAEKESSVAEKAPPPRAVRVPDAHKHVPTVRVDMIFGPEPEKPLSASKIDAEGRRAANAELTARKSAGGQEKSAAAAENPSANPKRKKKNEPDEVATVEI